MGTNGFAFVPSTSVRHAAPKTKSSLQMGIGLYYSTSTGNTETCAGYIGAAAGGLEAEDITDAETERSGTTWDDWLYNTLPDLDLTGKKVAVFGCGDQESYSGYYCDAAGELYDLFEAKGCKMFGMTSPEGYNHQSSKAERDGKFVGVMFDEDNQYDESEGRATAWIAQLKEEGFM